MSYQEYLARRRQSPEYRRVEKRLKPILDFTDAVFNLRMWFREFCQSMYFWLQDYEEAVRDTVERLAGKNDEDWQGRR